MRKHHSAVFKAQVVQDLLREEKTIAQLATEHGLHPNQLSKWKATALRGLPGLFKAGKDVETLRVAHEVQLTGLYAEIGRLTTQLAWLKKTWPASWIEPTASPWWIVGGLHCPSPCKPTC